MRGLQCSPIRPSLSARLTLRTATEPAYPAGLVATGGAFGFVAAGTGVAAWTVGVAGPAPSADEVGMAIGAEPAVPGAAGGRGTPAASGLGSGTEISVPLLPPVTCGRRPSQRVQRR